LGLKREVAGIKQVIIERLQVTLVGFGSGRRKNLVVLAPNDQHRWLVLTEVFLPLRIQGRVAAVTEEEIELYLVIAWAVEQVLIFGSAVPGHQLRILHAGHVLSSR